MKVNTALITKASTQHSQWIASKEHLNSVKQNMIIMFWWLYQSLGITQNISALKDWGKWLIISAGVWFLFFFTWRNPFDFIRVKKSKMKSCFRGDFVVLFFKLILIKMLLWVVVRNCLLFLHKPPEAVSNHPHSVIKLHNWCHSFLWNINVLHSDNFYY